MNDHVDIESVDLTNCDREPIHQIGAIQEFGALIAVTTDGMIAHYSVNFAEILGIGKSPEIGTQLNALFTSEAMAAIGLALGYDPAFVAAHHFARILILLALVPAFLRRGA